MKFSDILIGNPFYFNGDLYYKDGKYKALNARTGRIICFCSDDTVF